MPVLTELLKMLDDNLVLEGRGLKMTDASPLAGTVPELDSMGVMAIVNAAEERWGITIDDEEIDGEIFATVGSLRAFLQRKIDGA
jgi:acyl carrier protein